LVTTCKPLPDNQWAAGSFWHEIDNAIAEENCVPELANMPRDQLVKAYLSGWLVLHWPAGNC